MTRKGVVLLVMGVLLAACGGDSPSAATGRPLEACGPLKVPPNTPATVSFRQDIAPLFSRYGCSSVDCHGGPFPQSNYDLSSYASLFSPGAEATRLNTCAVVPGNAQESYLIEKLEGRMTRGDRMPLGKEPIAPQDLQLLRTWVGEGAPDN